MSQRATKPLLAVLRLIRLPNVFTAVADVVAGYFLVNGFTGNIGQLLLLMTASACIYGGGCALNDLCDFELDRRERPLRPLPSGAISRRTAAALSAILFGGGLITASLVGFRAMAMAGLLIGLVISYDCLTKEIAILGSLNMAACRGGNLLLGMLSGIVAGPMLIFPVISICYVFGLTTLSKFETSLTPRRLKAVASCWIGLALAAVVGLVAWAELKVQALLPLAGLVLMIAQPSLRWWRQAEPQNTGHAVKALVLAIPLLDAAYVAGVQDWVLALPVAGCAVLAVTAAKWMHVS